MTAALAAVESAESEGAEGGFSLRALARETWTDLNGADYHVLAKEIARRIGPDDLEAALNEALLQYARQFAMGQRPPSRKTKHSAGQRNSARSWKVQGVRQSWPQLRARIFTKDGQKAIGDCTAADLIFHADLLERQARQNQEKASFEREIAASLKANQVKCVRDLPDDVLAGFFGEPS
jgi:hypothetical protein